jgi:hypothetical protein
MCEFIYFAAAVYFALLDWTKGVKINRNPWTNQEQHHDDIFCVNFNEHSYKGLSFGFFISINSCMEALND